MLLYNESKNLIFFLVIIKTKLDVCKYQATLILDFPSNIILSSKYVSIQFLKQR